MANKSVMQHDFGRVAKADIPRATFNRDHGIKTTFDADYLVPFLVDDIVPGDTVNCNATLFARLATPLKPVMDNMTLETFYFFIPNRLIWDNWQKFCGEQVDPADSIDYTIPTLDSATFNITTADTIYDYMGMPWVASFDTTGVSSLPFRSYQLVWNEWFRDQNLQDSLAGAMNDGPDSTGRFVLKKRGKRRDYFTSCLPWPQKGATAVSIPLGTSADVISDATTAEEIAYRKTAGGTEFEINTSGATALGTINAASPAGGALYTDLSNATAATINQLRQSFAIQKLLERDARGGTRYIEVIKSHFGVTSSDSRLQRPEYLGGGSTPVGIQPVAQTSGQTTPVDDDTLGGLAGVGTALAKGHGFVKSFEEHGIILGLVNVRADLTYQQGLERMWTRSTRYDFLWPVFSHIGEQSVLNQELWWTSGDTGTINEAVFGYNGRYDEYRFKPSKITGLFRSDNAASLDVWHLSEDFASLPTLGDTFIQSNTPVDRVIAVNTEPHFIMDGYINYKHTRPLPVFGTPGLIDHF